MSQVIVCMGEPYPEIKREVSAADVFSAIEAMGSILGRLVGVCEAARDRERDLSDANRKLIDRLTAVDNELLAIRNGREAATQRLICQTTEAVKTAEAETRMHVSRALEPVHIGLGVIRQALVAHSAVIDSIADAVIPVPTPVARERAARRAKPTTKKRGKKNAPRTAAKS